MKDVVKEEVLPSKEEPEKIEFDLKMMKKTLQKNMNQKKKILIL